MSDFKRITNKTILTIIKHRIAKEGYTLLEESKGYIPLLDKLPTVIATNKERLFRVQDKNGLRYVVHVVDMQVVKVVKASDLLMIVRATSKLGY